jgi:hypothetical protein
VPHRPSERELRFMELLARQAANYLERNQIEQAQARAEKTRQLLVSELNHRVKNTLASVQAIAQQPFEVVKILPILYRAFQVSFNQWRGCTPSSLTPLGTQTCESLSGTNFYVEPLTIRD